MDTDIQNLQTECFQNEHRRAEVIRARDIMQELGDPEGLLTEDFQLHVDYLLEPMV